MSHIQGFNNQSIYFDRIIFSPEEGFPDANSLVVNTTSGVDCCILCQNTAFCAGSFYAPSIGACHLQLTQAAPASAVASLPASSAIPLFPFPSSNTSLPYPTASGAPFPAGNDTAAFFPTATGLLPTGFSTLVPSATPISSATEGRVSILPVFETPSTGTFDQPGAGTCSIGSLSLYLGRVYGQSTFPEDLALVVSNGPCGRVSLGFDEATAVSAGDLVPLIARRMIAMS
mgnify:CR=1 FL=1